MDSRAVQIVDCEDRVLIVGAGPGGLATAASLALRSIPHIILEREEALGSLWRNMTYDRLKLHLPKEFCQLPLLPFPRSYPKYPTRDQFVEYLEVYARHFNLHLVCNTTVTCAEFSSAQALWVVTAEVRTDDGAQQNVIQYKARSLVVATGENGEAVVPQFSEQSKFSGEMIHGKVYRNGHKYSNRRVLVVGRGNTGMEIALDLANFGAKPTLVARSKFHVMPRDLFGLISPFTASILFLKFFPRWVVDKLLVLCSRLTLGSTEKYNLIRPEEGPLQMKERTGQTPVLDVGTVAKVRNGVIKVVPGIDCLTENGARFVNGVEGDFDVIIMATGYTSTVSKWLKDENGMFGEDGFPKSPFPNGWKGKQGLYTVGFGRKGILGCAHDAVRVAEDISKEFKSHTVRFGGYLGAKNTYNQPAFS